MTRSQITSFLMVSLALWLLALWPAESHDSRASPPSATPAAASADHPTATIQAAQIRLTDSGDAVAPRHTLAPETDLAPVAFDWQRTTLETLEVGDHIAAANPDGGSMEFRVEDVRSFGDYQVLRLRSAEWVSTVTLSDSSYFATLATRQGAFSVAATGDTATLSRHAIMDQRWNRHELDYRHAPI